MTQQLAHYPADTSVPLDVRPIGTVLADWAATAPHRVAVEWLDGGELRAMTYAELGDAARAFARRLLRFVSPGQPVAVAASTSIDWLVLEYGAATAGTPLVPVNPAFTDDEIGHVLAAVEPAVLLADDQFRGTPLLERIAPLVRESAAVRQLADWRMLPDTDETLPEVEASDPFLVQTTSGTTGRPKGAVLSHRAAYNCAALTMSRFGGTAEDKWLNVLPMHHVGGSVSVVLSMLSVGGTVVLVPAFDAGVVLELIGQTRATIFGGVPTMYLALLDHPSYPTADVSSLRLLQCGGSVVGPSLIRRIEGAFGAVVCNAYGQSESPNATITAPDADDVTKAETIGTPLPHREVAIVDRAGATVHIGEIGELTMRSPLVMDGYVGVDAATNQRTLTPEGWLHTGDLCSMDDVGNLRIHGRLRDVIIRGGENIYPAELEDVFLRHPALADIAVVAAADEHWGEIPVAAYRRAPGAMVDVDELERYGREHLAPFKVPRRWIEVEAFPLTASGKVKKHELRSLVEERLGTARESLHSKLMISDDWPMPGSFG